MRKVFAGGLAALALLLMFFAFEKEDGRASLPSKKINSHSSYVEDKVNNYLSMTAKKIEIQQDGAEVQFHKVPQVGDRLGPATKPSESKASGVDFSGEIHESRVYEDLNRHPKDYSKWKGPDYRIQNEVTVTEEGEIRREAGMEEYARQFVENARRAGYRVQLNGDYVVISVQKMSENRSLDLRQPTGRGAN